MLGLDNFKFDSAEHLASKAYTNIVTQFRVEQINKPSILFRFSKIKKET